MAAASDSSSGAPAAAPAGPSARFDQEYHMNAHFGKAVSALGCDASGARLLTGGWDHVVRIWDFNGMTSKAEAFRTIDPVDEDTHGAYLINQVRWSPQSDQWVMVKRHAQPILYTRDGTEVYPFCRGDQYIRDQTYTKGHTSEVTCCEWNPFEQGTIVTGSKDTTLRVWKVDSLHKINHQVIKTQQQAAAKRRAGVTSLAYSSTGHALFAGTDDGSLYCWSTNGKMQKPEWHLQSAHAGTATISSIACSQDGQAMVTRGTDGTVKLWDIRQLAQSSAPTKPRPVGMIGDLDCVYEQSDVLYSPNQDFILCGTSVNPKGTEGGAVVWIDPKTLRVVDAKSLGAGVSVTRLLWHPRLDQIIVGASNGQCTVHYDPRNSKKGALLCAKKTKKRQWDDVANQLQASAGVVTPHALPMFKERAHYIDRRAEKRAMVPDKSGLPPPTEDVSAHALVRPNTKHEMIKTYIGLSKTNLLREDPAEAIRAYAAEAEANPMFVGHMYKQPTIFASEDDTHQPHPLDGDPAAKKARVLEQLKKLTPAAAGPQRRDKA